MKLRQLSYEASRAWQGTVSLVYPKLCAGCEVPLAQAERVEKGSEWLCRDCEEGLTRLEPPFCSVCCQPFDGAMQPNFQCANCGGRRLEFDFAVCAYLSRGLAREMVHQFKYERRGHLGMVLRELAVRAVREPRVDRRAEWVVVPVPLHPRRYRERQFNQAEEIGRGVAQAHNWPLVSALRRVRYTLRQARLDRGDRLKNLEGAFQPARDHIAAQVKDRAVLLVDDVLTTGATASTCAAVLRGMGASKVVVVTAVRG